MRNVGNKVRLQTREGDLLVDAAIRQHETANHQNRQHTKDQKTLPHPASTDCFGRRALKLDAERQTAKRIVQTCERLPVCRLSIRPIWPTADPVLISKHPPDKSIIASTLFRMLARLRPASTQKWP